MPDWEYIDSDGGIHSYDGGGGCLPDIDSADADDTEGSDAADTEEPGEEAL